MFINENSLHEIIFILDRNNEDYYLICQVYKVKKFVDNLNSFEIEKLPFSSSSIRIIKPLEITNHEIFEKKIAMKSIFIIADSLETFKSLNLNLI